MILGLELPFILVDNRVFEHYRRIVSSDLDARIPFFSSFRSHSPSKPRFPRVFFQLVFKKLLGTPQAERELWGASMRFFFVDCASLVSLLPFSPGRLPLSLSIGHLHHGEWITRLFATRSIDDGWKLIRIFEGGGGFYQEHLVSRE